MLDQYLTAIQHRDNISASCTAIRDILSNESLATPEQRAHLDVKVIDALCFSPTDENYSPSSSDLSSSLQLLSWLCRSKTLNKSTSNASNIRRCLNSGICPSIILTAINAFSGDSSLMELCGTMVMILACDSTENQSTLAAAGISEGIVRAIRATMPSASALEFLLRASRNLASNSNVGAQLISEGLTEAIVEVAALHGDNPEVVEAICWLTVNLSSDVDATTILGATGVCSLIVDIMGRWVDHNQITHGSCWALRNLACAAAFNYGILASSNVIEVLLAVLNRYKNEDETITEVALYCVANLACDRELAKSMVSSAVPQCLTEIAHVVLTRETSFMSACLEEAFLWAMRNVTSHDNNNTYFNIETLQQCVILLLREHTQCPPLCELALGTIGNMVYKNDVCATEMKKFWVCEAVAQATVGHFRDEMVLLAGMKTLYMLCAVHKSRLDEIGICKVAAAGIKAYGENEDIVKFSCEILLSLYYTSDEQRAELLSKGAIDSASGRVVKMKPSEEVISTWIPDDVVKKNEWFTESSDNKEDDDEINYDDKEKEESSADITADESGGVTELRAIVLEEESNDVSVIDECITSNFSTVDGSQYDAAASTL